MSQLNLKYMLSKLKFSRDFFRIRSISVFLLLALIITSCSSYHLVDFRKKKVHHFDMVKIGGTRQAIMINGKSPDNPVLVFLHGGPGFPMLPFDPFLESMNRLEEQYTIVYWEQRGTGKSFNLNIDASTMNMDQFVEDTREVINYVQDLLQVEKVFLWGHSWGSNIGAIYASKYPETLYAYISTGQSVNPFLNERLCYEFVLERATKDNNRRALKQLASIDTLPENYSLSDALTIRKWVYRYGGIVYKNDLERPYLDLNEIFTILFTPLYPIDVRFNLLQNPYFSAEHLWDDLKQIDLIRQAPRIDVPVYFLVGKHDIIVSHVLAEKYFNILNAPSGKKLIWFEKSAHRPFDEEKEKFLHVMNLRIYEHTYKGMAGN
jgi:pimeloyl-ACP methyl ester carboxylesterase